MILSSAEKNKKKAVIYAHFQTWRISYPDRAGSMTPAISR